MDTLLRELFVYQLLGLVILLNMLFLVIVCIMIKDMVLGYLLINRKIGERKKPTRFYSSVEELLTEYNLDFESINNLLVKGRGFITGNSMLYLYLKKYNIHCMSFKRKNLKIFISDKVKYSNKLSNYYTLCEILEDSGYEMDIEYDSYFDKSTLKFWKTYEISIWRKSDVGVIIVYHLTDDYENNPYDYILKTFDLNVEMTWWDSSKHILQTYDHKSVINRKLYEMGNRKLFNPIDEDLDISYFYIKEFGFEKIETPQISYHISDPRYQIVIEESSLEGCKCSDIIDFDEYDCSEYLQKSKDNILLKMGETWVGYSRKILIRYLLDHSFDYEKVNNCDTVSVYDTPHSQSLSHDSVHTLRFSDYSIYELIPRKYLVFNVNGLNKKTLYSLNCYSSMQWKKNLIGKVTI